MPTLKHTILLISLCILWSLSHAQIKSQESYSYQDTCIPTTVEEYNKLIRFFRESEDEKQLFKLNLLELARSDFDLSYERKVSSKMNFNFNSHFYIPNFNIGASHKQLHFQAELKYFHNFRGSAQSFHENNPFSGFYGTLGLGTYIYSNYNYIGNYNDHINPSTGRFDNIHYWESRNPGNPTYTPGEYQSVVWKNNKYEYTENILFLKFGYGYQYRLGKVGFASVALKMGVGSNYSFSRLYLMPEIELKLSFGISSFKKNRL